MRIEIFDLRLFMLVADHSNLTKGAELSALSVPAASMRLKRLEAAVGVTLFHRTSHGVELTSGGRVMLEHARRISRQVDTMMLDLRDHAGDAQVHIRLFATTVAMATTLPAQIGRFINDHPKVIVDVVERRSTEVMSALLEGRADIGVLNANNVGGAVEQYTFARERLLLAVPKGHRFAMRPSIRFNETLDEQHINMPMGSSVGSALPEIAAAAGLKRVAGTRVSGFESLCRLVEMGIGVGAVPQATANRLRGLVEIDFVPLEDPWADITVKLVTREDVPLPRLARELFDRLRATGGDA